VIVRDIDGLQDLAGRLDAVDAVVVDLETSDLNPRNGMIVGVGVATADGAAYVPVSHVFETTNALPPGQLPLAQVLRERSFRASELIVFLATTGFKERVTAAGRQRGVSLTTFLTRAADAAATKAAKTARKANVMKTATQKKAKPDWHSPLFFDKWVQEATNGGENGYEAVGRRTACWLMDVEPPYFTMEASTHPGNEWEVKWADKKCLLVDAVDLRDDAKVWKWFARHCPRVREQIPAGRRDQFVAGVYAAAEDNRKRAAWQEWRERAKSKKEDAEFQAKCVQWGRKEAEDVIAKLLADGEWHEEPWIALSVNRCVRPKFIFAAAPARRRNAYKKAELNGENQNRKNLFFWLMDAGAERLARLVLTSWLKQKKVERQKYDFIPSGHVFHYRLLPAGQ
jgi:hypothetical protein